MKEMTIELPDGKRIVIKKDFDIRNVKMVNEVIKRMDDESKPKEAKAS